MQVRSEKVRDKTGTFMTKMNTTTKRCIIKQRNNNLTFEFKKKWCSMNGPV